MLASELPEAAPSDPTGPRFRVEDIYPSVDGGRTPIKRIFGEVIDVWADLLREGHDQLAAELVWRHEADDEWRRAGRMQSQRERKTTQTEAGPANACLRDRDI